MKHFTKKLALLTLLAGLCGSAWAAAGDVTINANIDFSNAIVTSSSSPKNSIAGSVGSMTWENQWTMAPYISDGILRFGNFDGGVVNLQGNPAGSKDVVTISFDMAFGKLTGKHVGFSFNDADGNAILTQWFDAYNGDFDDSNPLGLNWDNMYHGSNEVIQERCVYFTITIDYEHSSISTHTKCYLYGTGKEATEANYSVELPSNSPIRSFKLLGNISNAGRYSTFDNLLIKTTEGYYSSSTADYTVKYVCVVGENKEEVKESVTRNGDVDGNIVLFASDKANFSNSDNSKRYIYVSDDAASNTIAEDGSTVVTVTFREANKYNYSVTSSYDGNSLDFVANGSCWEDQNTITVSYPRFQAYNNILVGRAPVDNNLKKTITVTGNNYTEDLEYTSTGIDNLYLLSEAENLGTGINTNATTYTDRVSNRLIIFSASGTLMTLPAGRYIFTLGAIGGDNSSHKVAYTINAGETQIGSGTCTGNFLTLITSDEFTLTEPTDITFTCSDPASGRGIDLVYVQKTGDVVSPPVTLNIGTIGYATLYYSDRALVVPAGVEAYTYTVTEGGAAYSTIYSEGEVIPADEAVVIYKQGGGDAIFEVSSENPTKSSDNMLKGFDTPHLTEGGDYYYALSINAAWDESTIGFYWMEDNGDAFESGAHKAYLALRNEGEVNVKSFYAFGNSTTAIQGIEMNAFMKDAVIYNLAGQRVSAPVKGNMYIVNGKKVMMK